ncbi:MAG: hypothetical protein ACFCD0_00500 [Gemmataceae bacterium]
MIRTMTSVTTLSTLLGLSLLGQPLLAAQKKEMDRGYDEFRKAQTIAVATLKTANLKAVAESFPPIYVYELEFSQVLPIKGSLRKGIGFQARYSKRQVNEPNLPVGKKVLVTLSAVGNDRFFVRKLELAEDANVKVARKATADVRAQLAKWRKNPSTHPRYKIFLNAKGLAVVQGGGPNTAIGFSPGGNQLSFSIRALQVFRGKLPVKQLVQATYFVPKPDQPRLPNGNRWIITYQIVNGRCAVATMDEASEILELVLKTASKGTK